MEPNFSGYVSRANLKCSDGRVISPGAFKHQDGMKVPVVYQHNHKDINQVLGYAILSHKDDGVWGDVYLNDTESAQNADKLVKHGSIDKFSIWAKDLVEEGDFVHSGNIQEVSLVLAGANPGANIYNVLQHSNVDIDDLLIIGNEIVHADGGAPKEVPDDEGEPKDEPTEDSSKTQLEVLESLNDEQKLAVNAFMDEVVKEAVTEALTEEPNIEHDNLSSTKGNHKMTRNAFQNQPTGGGAVATAELKHSDVEAVLMHAKGNPESGIRGFNDSSAIGSLREFVRSSNGKELMHADTYGIEHIETLFPDAQKLMARPTFVDRRQEWVKVFMAGTSHSPFSRVKTVYADITADEARAKGYIKAHQKTEEVFPVFARQTGPTWVIKKQRLDRQDIIDIVDFDVVAWMKVEMRGKLDEEIARAALFGDNRPAMVDGKINPDKIKDPGGNNPSGDGIRAIINDNDLYATTYDVPLPANPVNNDWNTLLDTVTEAGEYYLGSGNKTAFMSFRAATKLLTIRDGFGKRMYRNLDEVAGDMDVNRIVRVPTELFPEDVLAIVLDLSDYNFGTNKGGEITLFDDFDINFNQYHYLIETYLSGALVLPYSAQIFRRVLATDALTVPVQPAFANNVLTIPSQTGVRYEVDGVSKASGTQITLTEGQDVVVEAFPIAGYTFGTNHDGVDSWAFEHQEA